MEFHQHLEFFNGCGQSFDIPGVVVYMDDILVTGPSESDHLAALEEVLSRMEKAGFRLKKKKCWLKLYKRLQ